MSEHNIIVQGGTSVRLPTAGKYCDRDIIVTAEGGKDDSNEVWEEHLRNILERNTWELVVPNGTTKIGDYMFTNHSQLIVKELPDSITYVGSTAFQSCGKVALTKLPKNLVTLANSAFFNCGSLNITHIPANVESIGNTAISRCHTIRSLTFEGTPKTISATAFSNNNGLKDIYVPWAEGEVANAPWGATNTTIHYNYVEER